MLKQKIRAAEKWEKPQSTKLANGLKITITPTTFRLTRDGSEPSELEGQTCAKHAGWVDYSLAWDGVEGSRTLIVTKGQVLL